MIYFKSVIVCFFIMFIEMIHGILRARFLAPHVGDFKSRQIGVFTGSILILLIAYFTLSWINPINSTDAFFIGLIWFIGIFIFEMIVGHYVFKFSWKWIINDFNFFKGRLMILGMIVLALAPMIVGRLHGRW